MKCKFCGCTNDRPCRIPLYVALDGEPAVAFTVQTHAFAACGWLIPECCTAPACVEKAYLAIAWITEELSGRPGIRRIEAA